jgi:hypothetical protein
MKRRQAEFVALANYGDETLCCRCALPRTSLFMEARARFDRLVVGFEHLKQQPVTQFIDLDKNRQKVKLGHQNKVSSALSNAPKTIIKNR